MLVMMTSQLESTLIWGGEGEGINSYSVAPLK